MELWKELNNIKKRIFEGDDIRTIKEELSVLKKKIGEDDFEKILYLISKSIMQSNRDDNYTEIMLYLKELNDLKEEKEEKNLASPSTQEYLKMRSIVQKRQPRK